MLADPRPIRLLGPAFRLGFTSESQQPTGRDRVSVEPPLAPAPITHRGIAVA